MQSKKTSSRKPSEAAADVAGPQPEANTTTPVTKARKKTAASTSPKKPSKAAAPTTRHRKTAGAASDAVSAPVEQAAQAEVGESAVAPKVMAAASGGNAGSLHSDAVASVGNMTEPQAVGAAGVPASEKTGRSGITREEIEDLAHSYWVARGRPHGSHEEDWIRAEQELKLRRQMRK